MAESTTTRKDGTKTSHVTIPRTVQTGDGKVFFEGKAFVDATQHKNIKAELKRPRRVKAFEEETGAAPTETGDDELLDVEGSESAEET